MVQDTQTEIKSTIGASSAASAVLTDGLELLPCPFCNKVPKILNADSGYVISCENMMCGIRPNTYIEGLFLDGAIRNWNVRPNREVRQNLIKDREYE